MLEDVRMDRTPFLWGWERFRSRLIPQAVINERPVWHVGDAGVQPMMRLKGHVLVHLLNRFPRRTQAMVRNQRDGRLAEFGRWGRRGERTCTEHQ
jgi:hypothetical protein